MTRPPDEIILAFLEGTLDQEAADALLDRLERDPELAAQFRHAAAGFAIMTGHPHQAPVLTPPVMPPAGPHRVSPWWTVVAAAAALVIAIPATRWFVNRTPVANVVAVPTGMPVSPQPSFVLILHGRWPDAAQVDEAEARRRAAEYWSWTSELAERDVLLAAGDLRWEPGERLGAQAISMEVPAEYVDDPGFPVGMFALRAVSYEVAVEIARGCPHVRYGGSVSVRRVGSGFVTTPGSGDWNGAG